MKKLIFTLVFALVFINIFASPIEDIKKDIKTEFAKESLNLKHNLIKIQQTNNQQIQNSYYEAIIKEVQNTITQVLELSEKSYQKYKSDPQIHKEYLTGFVKDIEAYKKLLESDAAVCIADYVKDHFDMTKITNIHAMCFSGNQITLKFEYNGKVKQIIYLAEAKYISDISVS